MMSETHPSTTSLPTLEADYEILRDATTFALGPTGVAAQIIASTHAIFRLIGDAEALPLLRRLAEVENPVARAYGLYGLFHQNRKVFDEVSPQFRDDTAAVFRLMGCFAFTMPLNQLMGSWESAPATPRRKNFWQRLNSLFSSAK